MSEQTSQTKTPKPRFRVGDWVTYIIGPARHACEVVAYVGTVGKDAIPYYRLREPIWYGEPEEFEFPETSLQPATPNDLNGRYPPDQQPHDPHAIPLPDYE